MSDNLSTTVFALPDPLTAEDLWVHGDGGTDGRRDSANSHGGRKDGRTNGRKDGQTGKQDCDRIVKRKRRSAKASNMEATTAAETETESWLQNVKINRGTLKKKNQRVKKLPKSQSLLFLFFLGGGGQGVVLY